MWAGHASSEPPVKWGWGLARPAGVGGGEEGPRWPLPAPHPSLLPPPRISVGSMPGPASGLSAPALTWLALTQTPLSSRSSHKHLLDDPELIHVCFVSIPQTSKLRL